MKHVRLRQICGATDAKAFGSGGKGIRTPGLLIANETLYQLSYTPVIGKLRLARAIDFSSTETSSHLPAAELLAQRGAVFR